MRSPDVRVVLLLLLPLGLAAGCARDADPAAQMSEARELLAAGKSGEARVRLKNLLVGAPQTSEARLLLAGIALDEGNAKAADDELSGVPAAALNTAEAQWVRWRTDLAMDRAAKVLQSLDEPGLQISAGQRAILRAMALRRLGKPGDALTDLRAALQAEPENATLALETARTLAALGNLDQARQEVEALLTRAPDDADALLALSELQLRAGKPEPALASGQRALERAPAAWPASSRLTARLLVADAALATVNTKVAKEQLEAIQDPWSGSVGAQLLAARIALIESRFGEASDILQRIADAIPEDPRVSYLLADALLRGGNTARAVEVLKRRIALDANDQLARRWLARVLMQQSKPDQVLRLLDDPALEQSRADRESESLLSAARDMQQRAGVAISTLSERLAANPNDAAARAELALAHVQNGDPNRALTILSEARSQVDSPGTVAAALAANLALGNDREVNRIVKRLVDAAQPQADVLIAGADAAQSAARPDIATRLVDRALAAAPRDVPALMRRATLQFSERQFDPAAATLAQLIEISPQNAEVRVAQARVAEAKGDVDGARAALQLAAKQAPALPAPALMLAGLELRANEPAAAQRVLERFVQAAPADGDASYAAGLQLLEARRFDEARAWFRRAADQDPKSAAAWYQLGRAQIGLADRASAALAFKAAVAQRPDWLEANVWAVRVALDLRDYAGARQLATALAQRLPEHPVAWLLVGEVSSAEARWPEAAQAFERSFARRATSLAAVRDHRARVAGKLPRPDQPLLNWLAREPGDIAVRRGLAEHFISTDQKLAAIAQLEKILAVRPNDLQALNNLAWLLARTDSRRAEAYARQAESIAPRDAAVADTLGWVLFQSGKYPEARDVLRRAAAAAPKNASIHYRYAAALARAGDAAEARKVLEPLLTTNTPFDEREAALKLAQEIGR